MISPLEKRLLHSVGRAISDHDLIQGGDRILVAVSGGKDSLGLLQLLLRLRERAPVFFSLVAVSVDQCQPGVRLSRLETHFQSLGVEHRIVREDTFSIVKRLTEPGKSFCSVCSRLRRGILYNTAVELGCTKIALGHHREDLVETLLLSAFFSGALKAMPAKLVSDDGRNTVIRPLVYCSEQSLDAFAKEQRLPVIPCGLCSAQENQQRQRIKQLVAQMALEHPAVPGNLLNALRNVSPSHLLDPRIKRVDGLPRPSTFRLPPSAGRPG
jgi:tRNA 2-thiocytidine biosynthesis protein TtcA